MEQFRNSICFLKDDCQVKLYKFYRAVNEECAKDDEPKEDGAGGTDDLKVAVLVGEEDQDRKTADDNELEYEEDRPHYNVEAGDTG